MPAPKPITEVAIQMYTMGTGDCFVLKFMHGDEVTFRMLIDCGVISGSKEHIEKHVDTLRQQVGNHLNVLVITHEHKDHVLAFERAEAKFSDADFKIDEIWMGWPEQDGDQKVEDWKEEWGKKMKALAMAAKKLGAARKNHALFAPFMGARDEENLRESREAFAAAIEAYAGLNFSAYAGGLTGMTVVKEKLADGNISYYHPGDVIENLAALEGVRIYVLAPPESHDQVKVQPKADGGAYKHNKDVEEGDLFMEAVSVDTGQELPPDLSPFDPVYFMDRGQKHPAYDADKEAWRRIDHDWLFSAGHLALRLEHHLNNLTFCLAIEHVESGKVLLFPGDAEFGSWKTWHDVDWSSVDDELTTEMLLNRVVFYKVAHHLSNNGTAKELGLEMMTHPDLCAMASLDYRKIMANWKSTMPSRMILKDLLERTRGRLIVLNEEGLHYDMAGEVPLKSKIAEARESMSAEEKQAFDGAVTQAEHYIEYRLKF